MSLGPLQSLTISLVALASLSVAKVACTDDPRQARSPTPGHAAPSKPAMNGEVPAGLDAFEATVEQHLKAGHYSYLELSAANGQKVWLATMGDGVPQGATVAVRAYSAAHNFESRRLNRRFDQLLFGQVRPAQIPQAIHP